MSLFPTLLYIAYILIGALIVLIVITKPKLFWPILIIVTIGTGGLMMPKLELPLVEELFCGSLVFGIFLTILIRKTKIKKQVLFANLHEFFFFFLIIYLIIQTFRGIIIWEELKLFRWIIYYLIIISIFLLVSKSSLPVPSTKKMLRLILISSLAYFSAYLFHGLYIENIKNLSVIDLNVQGAQWSGPAYAVFSLIIAIPAVILNLKRSPNLKIVGYLLIIVALIIGKFYDSRAVWVILTVFTMASFIVIKKRHVIILLLLLFLLSSILYGNPLSFFNISTQNILSRNASDVGRLTMLDAGINAIKITPLKFLFGYGMHSHHFIIGSYLRDIGYSGFRNPYYVTVSGLPGMLIDFGIIGILLLFINFFLTLYKLLIQKNKPEKFIFMITLLFAFLWLLIVDVDDNILFFFLIMPSGLLIQLVKNEKRIDEKI